jgi:5'-nucleotidase, C-terminal domain
MTGAQIVLLLNQATQVAFAGSNGAYPYAAGVRYDVDQNAAFPNQVSNVEINVRLAQAAWTPIVSNQTYTVVTNSFAASGGDGYLAFAQVPRKDVTDLFLEYALSLVAYARKVKVLTDPPLSTYSTKKFVPLATRAPISPPTSAPISPPTSAPISPPTSAPITSPTDAPIIPPTSAPIRPPTTAPTLRKKKGKDKGKNKKKTPKVPK